MEQRSPTRFVLEGIEGLAVTFAVMLTWAASKRWLRDWGSLPDERRRSWPGDDLVPPGHTTFTRGVTIDAPAPRVWPWLVQFGLGRAGFYSYELLERLVGIPVNNVESIVPAYQDLKVGDEILLHPKAPGIPVALLKVESHICFGKAENERKSADATDPVRSWSMYIEPLAEDSSRLLLRSCVGSVHDRSFLKRFATHVEEAIDFVMEQRMLRSIKRLAEQEAAE